MVRQAGGISPDLAADIYGDRAHLANRRAPGLFRRGGMEADRLVEAMQQAGYLPMEGNTVDLASTAMDRVREAMEGEAVYSLEQMDEAARRAYAERQAERFSDTKDKQKLAEDLFGVIDAMPADTTARQLAAQFDAAVYLSQQGITDVPTQKPSSSAPQSEPTATPDSTRPTLSPKQRRMADGTLAILRAVQANQEREAMDQAQEVIARAARKR